MKAVVCELCEREKLLPFLSFPFINVDVVEEEDTSRDLLHRLRIDHPPIPPKDDTKRPPWNLLFPHLFSLLFRESEISAYVSADERPECVVPLMWREKGERGGGEGERREEEKEREKREERVHRKKKKRKDEFDEKYCLNFFALI